MLIPLKKILFVFILGSILFCGCKNKNNPPDRPSPPSGLINGKADSIYSFSTRAIDQDGDSVAIRFDWDDGVTSDWSSNVTSGQMVTMSHSWDSSGTYNIKTQSKDMKDLLSNWSIGCQIIISTFVNNPPNTPPTPSGPSNGQVGLSYDFTTSATDPDGDSVSIRFDWGNGDTSDWSSWRASGDSVSLTHSWSDSGSYSIKAQAKDKNGGTSGWSSGHQITISGGGVGWTKTFGGVSADYGSSVQQTSDAGYIIAGSTNSYGAGRSDVYLIKSDANGNQQWSKTFGDSSYDYGFSVQQTSDGGYIITGEIVSYGEDNGDVYLIKTDATGNQQWSKTFGDSSYDGGNSIQQTQDGGYIITGDTRSYGAGRTDVYLIETDATGNQQWSKTFGGSSDDWGLSVCQTSDGGYIITGETKSYGAGNSDVYLIKTDPNGNEQWSKTFGGSSDDWGESVCQTTDGGYIIAGSTSSFGAGGADVYLIKTDVNGNQQWYKTLGGATSEAGYSVQQTSDGGYIIAGYTDLLGAGNSDVYLIKTDATGNQQWSKTFGGSSDDGGESVCQTTDGGYIIAGSTNSFGAGGTDVYLIKTDANGNTLKTFSFGQNRNYPKPPRNPRPKLPLDLKNTGQVKGGVK